MCSARCTEPLLLMEAVRQADVAMVKALLTAGARLYPQHVTLEALSNVKHMESAYSIACDVSSDLVTNLLQQHLPRELLLIARQGLCADL